MERSRNVSWIVFDLGEVLSQAPGHLAAVARLLGAEESASLAAYWQYRRAYDAGASALAYWRDVGAAVGVEVGAELAARLTQVDADGWIRLHPDSAPLLSEVKAAGHGLGLLSNLPRELAARVRTEPWAGLFDALVFSCDVGAAKPGPAIYQAALDLLTAADPGRDTDQGSVVFFDDRAENVAAAASLGWRARLWAGHQDARRFLASIGSPL